MTACPPVSALSVLSEAFALPLTAASLLLVRPLPTTVAPSPAVMRLLLLVLLLTVSVVLLLVVRGVLVVAAT